MNKYNLQISIDGVVLNEPDKTMEEIVQIIQALTDQEYKSFLVDIKQINNGKVL